MVLREWVVQGVHRAAASLEGMDLVEAAAAAGVTD
jgi:hypothetical protein